MSILLRKKLEASYEDYFNQDEYMDHASEPPSAKTLSVFKDPNEVR